MCVKQCYSDRLLVADGAYKRFRETQVRHGGAVTAKDKAELRKRFGKLDTQLDGYLAGEYGVNTDKPKHFEAWKASHEPFHWLVEFFGIMCEGGFDVIIGNPPYISAARVRKSYSLMGYATSKCSDIYANVQERCVRLLLMSGRCGMIVPLSLSFSRDFQQLRDLLYRGYCHNWFSSFGRIPAALFSADVRVRNTIHIGAKGPEPSSAINFTTVLHRWFEAFRSHLMQSLAYTYFDPSPFNGLVPKINTQALSDAVASLASRSRKRLDSVLSPKQTQYPVYFKKSAYNWLNSCKSMPPCYDVDGQRIAHTKFGVVWFEDAESRDIALLLLNGKIMFAFWCMVGDDFDVTRWMFADFPSVVPLGSTAQRKQLLSLTEDLDACMRANVSYKLNAGKRVGNYNLARCRSVTDKSDVILADIMGLSDVLDDIELMYVQVVRTDFGLDDEVRE